MVASSHSLRSSLLDGTAVLAFLVIATGLALRTGLRPREPLAGVAVVFAPWLTAEEAVLRATAPGARLMRLGAIASIVVVAPRTPVMSVDRVLADGAFLVVDPLVLAACTPALLPDRRP